MKRRQVFALLTVAVLIVCALFPVTASAGIKEIISTPLSADGVGLNDTDWNISGDCIARQGDTVVISAQEATAETRIISKTRAKASADFEEIAVLETELKLTALPSGERFVLAFGLSGIESELGESGNVEIAFTNDGGIKVGAAAYTDDGAVTLFEPMGCGVSLNSLFSLRISVTSAGELLATVNRTALGSYKLPVTGEGRFGILQTGSCGAVVSGLTYTCYYYETPENTDIFEDFERGDFNANLFTSSSTDNGIFPSGIKIEDYNGSKVLRFQNTKVAYFCTLHPYSNFEISFDIPYFSRQFFYDEYGNVSGKPASNLAVGFGEEVSTPIGYAYTTDVELLVFRSDRIYSENQKAFDVSLKGMGVTDTSTNEGYSVKLTVVDGHYEVGVKALKDTAFKTVATSDFSAQRSGYVNIWSTGNADFAIDNLRIINLDNNPNRIEVPYRTSLITAEDYVPTAEESTKTFRPAEADQSSSLEQKLLLLDICLAGAAVLLCGVGAVVYAVKRKRREPSHEKEQVS